MEINPLNSNRVKPAEKAVFTDTRKKYPFLTTNAEKNYDSENPEKEAKNKDKNTPNKDLKSLKYDKNKKPTSGEGIGEKINIVA